MNKPRYAFIFVETLCLDTDVSREQDIKALKVLRDEKVFVVALSLDKDPQEVQTLLHQSNLLEYFVAIRCYRDSVECFSSLPRDFVLYDGSVVVSGCQEHYSLTKAVGLTFILAINTPGCRPLTSKPEYLTVQSLIGIIAKMTIRHKFKITPARNFNKLLKDFHSPAPTIQSYICENVLKQRAMEVIDEKSNVKVLHVYDFVTLIQAVDKVKYLCANKGELTFLRGQSMLYGHTLVPSAYRNIGRASIASIDDKIKDDIIRLKDADSNVNKNIRNLPNYVIEGLLQQYENKSRWIDAVDNIWVALWFACHRRWCSGNCVRYMRRNLNLEKDGYNYAYILILGVKKGEGESLDLRTATPSIFVRPHVQHGVLLRSLKDGKISAEMNSMIRGIVRIDLCDALSWIGNSPSLSADTMFPSPAFDSGFRDLMKVGLAVTPSIQFM